MKWMHKKLPGWKVLAVFAVAGGVLAVWQWDYLMMAKDVVINRLMRHHTVEGRVKQYGESVQARMAPFFEKAGVAWPARRLVLIGLKEERLLEVWAEDRQGNMKCVRAYPVLGASGTSGPKLRSGDGQVPEGLYSVESLNPNSAFHLSLRINYPNIFDRGQAEKDGRKNLGGDIMIHGGSASAGCLAMGDEAAEDLFIMAALAEPSNVEVVLSPCDLRVKAFTPPDGAPAWTGQLYQDVKGRLQRFGQPHEQ